MNIILLTNELKLGDVVEAFEGPYGTATVKQIKDDIVTFFRPYVANENWSHTGGVLCYVGIEEFSTTRSNHSYWKVLRRGEVR
jgi:hypothetical protein